MKGRSSVGGGEATGERGEAGVGSAAMELLRLCPGEGVAEAEAEGAAESERPIDGGLERGEASRGGAPVASRTRRWLFMTRGLWMSCSHAAQSFISQSSHANDASTASQFSHDGAAPLSAAAGAVAAAGDDAAAAAAVVAVAAVSG
jgi:hypothetical protein